MGDKCEAKPRYRIDLIKKTAIRYPDSLDSPDWVAVFEQMTVRNRNECWVWLGGCSVQGYGQLRWRGTNWSAHRIAYATMRGEIGDKYVLHHCDNPSCCNPEHLFLGTHWDNMQDKRRKKREARLYGELSGAAKVTEADAFRIMVLSDILTTTELAKVFGISHDAINAIITGRSWRGVYAAYIAQQEFNVAEGI